MYVRIVDGTKPVDIEINMNTSKC